MPELDYAFVADFARAKNGSLDALSIGIDTIAVPQLPASVQLVLALRLHFDRIDCQESHLIETIVQDPDGSRLAEVHVNAESAWPPIEPAGDRVNVEAVLPLLLPLSTVGPHSVELGIDGRPLKTINFMVGPAQAAL